MTTFDLPNFSNPQDWMNYVHDITGGYFGYFFLLIIFIASLSGLGFLPIRKAFAGAMWLTTFIAILLYLIGVLPWIPVFACIVGVIGSMLMLKFSEE